MGSAFLAWAMARVLARLSEAGAEIVVPGKALRERSPRGSFRAALAAGTYGLSNRASGWARNGIASSVEATLRALEEGIVRPAWQQVVSEVQHDGGPGGLGEAWSLLRPEIESVPCPVGLVWAGRWLAGVSLEEGLAEADRVFAAVKRDRPGADHRGMPVGKCGQCGRREAVGGHAWKAWRRTQRRLSEVREVILGLRLDPADRLCSVCLVKRLAGYLSREAKMPSTSQVAADHWLDTVRSFDDLRSLADAVLAKARKIEGFDEDPFPLLFRRSRRALKRSARPGSRLEREPRAIAELEATAEALASSIRHRLGPGSSPSFGPEPSNSLAVVVFDGDDVGRAVHRQPQVMADRLGSFAGVLEEMVRRFDATPVYLGGDEGVVLCPIETVLALSQAIQAQWQETLRSATSTAGSRDSPPTLSMGVCIFDRERPMGGAILEAQAGVEAAKALDGKDGLSVTVQTASGSTWHVCQHWGAEWDRVRAAVRLVRGGELSSGWAYDVEELLRSMPLEELEGSGFRDALRAEIERITRRRTLAGSSPEQVWSEIAGPALWQEIPEPQTLSQVPDLFHLVGYLARHPGGAAEAA